MIPLLMILLGVVMLTLGGWPGLLDDYPTPQAVLIVLGVVLSITGETLTWAEDRSLRRRINELQPRSLSETQRAELVKQLLSHERGSVGFCSRLMDGESADFAEQLAAAFKEAGWSLAPHIKTSLNEFPGFLSAFVTGNGLDSKTDAVVSALRAVDIDCRSEPIQESSVGGRRQPNTIYIVVGRQK